LLLGLLGKKQSGKSTVASLLMKDYNFVKISFADRLKMIVSMVYSIPLSYCFNNKDFEVMPNFTVRNLLQKWGNLGRQVYKDSWILPVKDFINSDLCKGKNIVIDDVRMSNEVLFIQKESGKLVRIIRPEIQEIQEQDRDVSETEQDSIIVDAVLVNDGSLDYLKRKLVLTLDQLNKPKILLKKRRQLF